MVACHHSVLLHYRVSYGLEVLKGGILLEQRNVSEWPFFTFGRSPTAGMLLEHPTASRLHAVLQFNRETKEAFLYDCDSTQGTFINKNQLQARVYTPVRVGDTIRFGQSSRMYVLSGPADLMPEEGLNKQQKQQLAMLKAAQAHKAADEAKAKAQMEAALSGGGADGVSWGMMGDDAEDEMKAQNTDNIDWRKYVEKHTITDRQTKLLDKIRKREYKVRNLEAECSKISAKERSEGGLTQGQAATLVRNERALEALREELEELEEQLQDSITDSIKGKQAAKAGKEHTKKRKRQPDSEDEYAAASDSDDEFYDRTAAGVGAAGASKRAAVGGKGKAGKAGEQPAQMESAETLYATRSALLGEQQHLESGIKAERQRLEQQQAQMGQRTDPQQAEQQKQDEQAADDRFDSLDAYMTNMEQTMEQDKVSLLQKELDEVRKRLARTERLIQIADPDGWYKPKADGNAGSSSNNAVVAAAAAAAARAQAKAAIETGRERRAAAVTAQRAGWAAANAGQELQPEVEQEEDNEGQQAAAAVSGKSEQPSAVAAAAEDTSRQQTLTSSHADQSNPSKPIAATKPQPVVIKPKGVFGAPKRPSPGKQQAAAAGAANPAAAQAAQTGGGSSNKQHAAQAAAQQLMKEFAQPAAVQRTVKGPSMPPPGYQAPAVQQAGSAKHQPSSSNVQAAAAARVAATIAILTSHREKLPGTGDEDNNMQQAASDANDEQEGGWLPPGQQTGDGKTSLNAKYGY
eukprot:GHRR01007347.1.p1 GENE.GHRR01007347.1~~GHRR01007347.1.p1  ORF type:complete len:746 (+),score=339.15 GHRR01007347.1:207-2444(+)